MPLPTINPMTKSVLDRVTDKLMLRLKDMVDDDASQLWNMVYQGPISDVPVTAYPACALQQGTEDVIHDLWPHTEKVCTFFVEFRFNNIAGLDTHQVFRYYLAKLQQRLFGPPVNVNLDGLTVNVMETGSNPEIEGQQDRAPGGLLIFNVHYRHHTGDPYHLISETPNYAYGQ
jgi:hypothetical protein